MVASLPALRDQARCVFVLPAILVLTAIACSKPSASRDVADRYMELYYARKDVAQAVKLCSAAARTRLEGELRAIQGVPPDASEPRVTFSLTAGTNPAPTQATYTYRVTTHTSGVGNVVTTLTLTDEGGRWMVTSIKENEGPPTS